MQCKLRFPLLQHMISISWYTQYDFWPRPALWKNSFPVHPCLSASSPLPPLCPPQPPQTPELHINSANHVNSVNHVDSVRHVNNVNSVNSINSVSSLLCGVTFISDGIFCFLHCFNNSKFNFARFGLIIQVNVILETLYTKAASVKSLKKIAHQVKLRPFDEGLIFGQNLSQESKILPKTGLFQQNHLPSKTWHRLQIWAPVKFESVRK